MTLDKSIRQSPRDNLRNCLKACQNPLKSYLVKAIILSVIFIGVGFQFFSQTPLSLRAMGFTALALLILLVLGYTSHHQDLCRDLELSIVQYQHDKIDFFKTHGDKQEEVINDFMLIYEADHTATVQFTYQGKPSQLPLSRE